MTQTKEDLMGFSFPCNGTETATMTIERRYQIGSKVLSLCLVQTQSSFAKPGWDKAMHGGSSQTEVYISPGQDSPSDKVADGYMLADFDLMERLGVLVRLDDSMEEDGPTTKKEQSVGDTHN